jgi:hypothetical protein
MDGKPILRGARDELAVIAARHQAICMPAEQPDEVSAHICGRCEQLWPCDARQLVDVMRAIGRGEH